MIEVMRTFQVKIGIRNIVMPGGAQADDRGDEVDRTEDRAETGQRETEHPQVTAEPGAVADVGQRGVGGPAEARPPPAG